LVKMIFEASSAPFVEQTKEKRKRNMPTFFFKIFFI
jgi:hypothetical protein